MLSLRMKGIHMHCTAKEYPLGSFFIMVPSEGRNTSQEPYGPSPTILE